ncbi:hypothetical protein RCL1_007307 [Eukaryota sp. TZLM3-RCL]
MLNFTDAVILAPMVRVTNLPFRLTCYDYGADICYTEELIDYALLKSTRTQVGDMTLMTDPNDKIVFATIPREKDKLILQIGSNDGSRASRAIEPIADVISEVGLNLGCPVKKNRVCGIGHALSETPERAADVISTLKRNLNIPISAKIRIQNTREETNILIENLLHAGITSLTVHGRTKDMKGTDKANWEEIAFALEIAKKWGVPTIANGGVETFQDVDKIKQVTKCDGVMIGRAALENPSVFSSLGLSPPLEVTNKLLSYSINTRHVAYPPKYNVVHFNHGDNLMVEKIQKVKSFSEICRLFDVDYLDEVDLGKRSVGGNGEIDDKKINKSD